MHPSQILLIAILVVVLIVILIRMRSVPADKSPRRKRKSSSGLYCAAPHYDNHPAPIYSKPISDSIPAARSLPQEKFNRHPIQTASVVEAPTTPIDTASHVTELSANQHHILKSHPKPATVPTFARNNADDDRLEISTHGYRFRVESSGKDMISIPKNFSAIKQWEGMITGVYDQERCGSCWAFATCSSFTDRIRIQSKGKFLADGDYLSPFHLAACMKCGIDGACPRVCEGNYLDDVLQYLVDEGAAAQSDIEKYSTQGEEYRCFNAAAHGAKLWKGKRKYRVNIYPPSMLTDKKLLLENETAIMEDIYRYGPVNCIIKVYVPMDNRNFYLHKTGIYGYGWASEPKETDGYHAINIVGWGEEEIAGKVVKYWIVRNSWGDSWGVSGLARVLRGVNFGMIESDCWGISVE
jgi:hypothetical protein